MKNKELTYTELHEMVMKFGEDVFGNKVKFNKWLSYKSIPLGDKPVNLINNYDGLKLVYNELGRIEHGVYS